MPTQDEDFISFERVNESNTAKIQSLKVYKEQEQFVGTISEILKAASSTDHLHMILSNNEVVGFFNVDVAYGTTYSFAGNRDVGLRAFFIAKEHQGTGLCKRTIAALADYLMKRYSEYDGVVLTVNVRNPAAYKCYLAGGFVDSGELYHGGAAGPQHIMRMHFPDESK